MTATTDPYTVDESKEFEGVPYRIANGAIVRDKIRIERRVLQTGGTIVAIRVENAETGRFAWCPMYPDPACDVGDTLYEFGGI